MAEEELDEQQPGGFRPFWSGTITFGLVTVPVALHAATRSGGTSLRMIGPDEAPVRRRYVCSVDETPLDADDIVRGYEIEKGKFVVVTDEELEAIEPRKSREIDLQLFVARDEIDPIYFERAYFLVPTGGTNKAYRLLAEAMEREKRVGIATFVMRGKEYLVAIIAENGVLRAETLRFADEVRTPEDVGLPPIAKPAAADVKKFETQIAKKAAGLDESELLDEYSERLAKLVAKKQKAGAVVKAPEPRRDEEEGGEVVDLLAALSRSLAASGTTSKKSSSAARPKRKPARKASTTRKSSSARSAKRPSAKRASTKKKTAAKKRA